MAAGGYIFRAGNHEFSESGGVKKKRKFGKKLEINDALDNFVFLTRSKGFRGTFFWGSGVVVQGEADFYLATAAHK